MVRVIRLTRLSVGVSLLLLAGAAPAFADPVETQVTFDGTANGENVTITYNGNTTGLFAGQFNMHLDNQPGNKPGPEFLSFCVDLDHYITSNYKVYERSTSDGLNNGGVVSYLYQTYGQGTLDNQHAAALQLALWDEVTDGGDGLSKGAFQASVDPGLANLVALYEAAAVGHTATGLWLDASANGNDKNRGQSVPLPGTPNSPTANPTVPEPSSLALLALGGLGLAGWRRWKKKRTA